MKTVMKITACVLALHGFVLLGVGSTGDVRADAEFFADDCENACVRNRDCEDVPNCDCPGEKCD